MPDVVACGSYGCYWSFKIVVRIWAVPISWSNEIHSIIVCCVNILFPLMGSVNTWRNSYSVCRWCTCSVDRELQQAWLREGCHVGTSSKSTQSLKRTEEKYSARNGCCRKGRISYPYFILPWCKTWESFVVKLHFKHIYHPAFDFHECSSCRAGGGIWCGTMCGEPCLLPVSFLSLQNACYAGFLTFNTFCKC